MTLWLWNLGAYSVQLAVLVATGLALSALLRLHAPQVALRFWQALFAIAVLLPIAAFRTPSSDSPLQASVVSFTTSTVGNAESSPALDPFVAALAAIAAGALVRLAWLAAGMWRLRSIRRGAAAAPALDELASSLQRDLHTAAAVRISDDVGGPATIGVRRPVILLPSQVLQLQPAVQRAVLCHELVHVRRRDWISTIAEEVWCAILWFHPGARILASRVALAREMLVDSATIGLTRDRRAYAAALLHFSDPPPHLLGATPLIGRRHFAQRIAGIAEEVSMSRLRIVSAVTVATLAVIAATATIAAYVPLTGALSAQKDQVVFTAGDGVTLPAVVHEVKPHYTPEAMKAKIQGSVFMRVVVLASGDVGDVTVTKSLDEEHGLDKQAMAAAKQWKFKPGTKDGKPVNVAVTVEMTFTLKK